MHRPRRGRKALRRLRLARVPHGRDTDRAVAAGEEGLELSNQAGLGGAATAGLLRLLGWMTWGKGDYERAKELLEESLTLSRDADDKFGVADSLLMLGSTLGSLGDPRTGKAAS